MQQLEPIEAVESRQEQIGPWDKGGKTGRALHQAKFPFPLPLISEGDASQQATKICLEMGTLEATSDPHILFSQLVVTEKNEGAIRQANSVHISH